MDQEITISYVWTADELIRAQENHARAQCRPRYRAGIKFLSLMAILSGWCYYQAQGWSVLSVLLPAVGIYLLVLRKYDVRWSLRRHFRKRADRSLRIEWTLAENDLHSRTEHSESRHQWSLITKARKASNGFLLYPNEKMFYWLPLTAFASEEDQRRAEDLLRRKVQDFADIR